jgi:hypothetical protein
MMAYQAKTWLIDAGIKYIAVFGFYCDFIVQNIMRMNHLKTVISV